MSGLVGDRSEAELIEMVRAAVPIRPTPIGPGDDAALLPGHPRRVLTTDALVEGVHFLRAHPPRSLGWKALAVNLSDVAAMGAIAEAFTLTVALPADLPLDYWRALLEGLGAFAGMHHVYLAGGDTVRAGARPGGVGPLSPLMIAITAWGEAPYPDDASPRLLTRDGGRPGDVLMVAGPIGRAGLGLADWLTMPHPAGWGADRLVDQEKQEQHLQPSPPLWAGPWALAHGASAGMDLSDGLATDVPRLAAASKLTIAVDLDRLPPDDLLGDLDPRVRAASGEDYGLAVLVPPERVAAFTAQGFAAIGEASAPTTPERTGAVTWRLDGREVPPVTPGFSHFAPR